ncbi:hypothetical protein LZ023_26820 [Pseudomonas silvicola]|nr:hypothetical protein LZ023_26820 [Pseudomonas silvicola]
MKYPQDDQNEINRLHAEFIVLHEPHNEQVMAFQDASYALGLKRGQAREAALQQRLNEADQRVDAMNGAIRLLREFRDVAYGGFLDNDHVRRTRTDLDAFLSQLTKDSPEVGS